MLQISTWNVKKGLNMFLEKSNIKNEFELRLINFNN